MGIAFNVCQPCCLAASGIDTLCCDNVPFRIRVTVDNLRQSGVQQYYDGDWYTLGQLPHFEMRGTYWEQENQFAKSGWSWEGGMTPALKATNGSDSCPSFQRMDMFCGPYWNGCQGWIRHANSDSFLGSPESNCTCDPLFLLWSGASTHQPLGDPFNAAFASPLHPSERNLYMYDDVTDNSNIIPFGSGWCHYLYDEKLDVWHTGTNTVSGEIWKSSNNIIAYTGYINNASFSMRTYPDWQVSFGTGSYQRLATISNFGYPDTKVYTSSVGTPHCYPFLPSFTYNLFSNPQLAPIGMSEFVLARQDATTFSGIPTYWTDERHIPRKLYGYISGTYLRRSFGTPIGSEVDFTENVEYDWDENEGEWLTSTGVLNHYGSNSILVATKMRFDNPFANPPFYSNQCLNQAMGFGADVTGDGDNGSQFYSDSYMDPVSVDPLLITGYQHFRAYGGSFSSIDIIYKTTVEITE